MISANLHSPFGMAQRPCLLYWSSELDALLFDHEQVSQFLDHNLDHNLHHNSNIIQLLLYNWNNPMNLLNLKMWTTLSKLQMSKYLSIQLWILHPYSTCIFNTYWIRVMDWPSTSLALLNYTHKIIKFAVLLDWCPSH